MAELKDSKRKNGKLSLYPLKFESAVKEILKVKPEGNTKTKTLKDK
jgi:hypothetical protein